MNRFKISTRVTALAGLMSLMLLGIGALGLWGIVQSNIALQSMYEDRMTATADIGAVQALLLRNRLALAVAAIALAVYAPTVARDLSWANAATDGGDLITAIDDSPVTRFDDLLIYLERYTHPGDTVVLTVLRDGDTIELDVTLVARPSN